jgi:hypothetical protein
MARRDMNSENPEEQISSNEESEMVRGRADNMEDATNDTEEFEDTEDLDEEEEEGGEGSF